MVTYASNPSTQEAGTERELATSSRTTWAIIGDCFKRERKKGDKHSVMYLVTLYLGCLNPAARTVMPAFRVVKQGGDSGAAWDTGKAVSEINICVTGKQTE